MTKNIFRVMVDPRGFIRSISKSAMGTMPVFLAWVIGLVYLIREAASFQLSLYYPYGWILLVAAVLAIPVGYIIIYIFSFFLLWAGKLFKGKGSYGEIFTASAYGRVPEVFVLVSWLLLTVLLQQATFTQIYVLPQLPQIIAILLFVQIVFYLWEFVISLHTLGEVQGFSAWMGLWNYILAGVLLVLVELFVQFLVASMFSLTIYGAETMETVSSLMS